MWWARRVPPFPPRAESADSQDHAFTQRLYDGDLLARSLRIEARKSAFRSAAAKTLLIVLGALTATKAVADDLVGSESAGVVLTYAIIGVLVAMVAGLLASFPPGGDSISVLLSRTNRARPIPGADARRPPPPAA